MLRAQLASTKAACSSSGAASSVLTKSNGSLHKASSTRPVALSFQTNSKLMRRSSRLFLLLV